MNLATHILLYSFFLPASLFGQKPDFSLEQLHPAVRSRNLPPTSATAQSASVALYSNGTSISLVIDVKDPNINMHPNFRFADHVEIWFALPKSAYPQSFEYQFHPDYIAAEPMQTRGELPERPRFFSAYSDYANGIDRNSFLQAFDYPSREQIIRDSLRLPIPQLLKNAYVPYGMVQFALFPDNRPPIHLNRKGMRWIEQAMSLKMGDLEAGIEYLAEENENGDGYRITAQFSPQALGFVQLPELNSLRMMVDVFKSNTYGATAKPVLSTSSYREPNRPYSFNLVNVRTPLNTNFTPVPNEVFGKLNFHPLGIYTMDDWLPCQVEVEGLIYKEGLISDKLTEVGFVNQPFRYESFNFESGRAERFLIRSYHLNSLPHDQEFFIFGNQVLKSDRVLIENREPIRIQNDLFRFPDGFPGVITNSLITLNPYGWGPEGNRADRMLEVQKVFPEGSASLLTIRQTEGDQPICTIGNLSYPDFYVSQLDWIREGEVMVIRLNRQGSIEKKRIKVAFLEEGREVEITEVR
ncbi:MAG: hypothetical protein AAF927_05565 [Bacteroidota bacterium]